MYPFDFQALILSSMFQACGNRVVPEYIPRNWLLLNCLFLGFVIFVTIICVSFMNCLFLGFIIFVIIVCVSLNRFVSRANCSPIFFILYRLNTGICIIHNINTVCRTVHYINTVSCIAHILFAFFIIFLLNRFRKLYRQGFFLVSSGAEIRSLSQWDLGDFFSQFE